MTSEAPRKQDLTARARIRDAAIRRFADEGIAEAKLKDIAADAGVSIPLITHHFGTKDGLRLACDEYLASVIREKKTEGIEAAPQDALTQIREFFSGTPLMAYFARTIADGTPHADTLIDKLIDDAQTYSRHAVGLGVIKDHPRLEEFITLLTLWQVGLFTVNRQLQRHLSLDMLEPTGEDVLQLGVLSGELLTANLINVDYAAAYDKLQQDQEPDQPEDAL